MQMPKSTVLRLLSITLDEGKAALHELSLRSPDAGLINRYARTATGTGSWAWQVTRDGKGFAVSASVA